MHEHVDKYAKMHKNEESQMGGKKQARQAYQYRMERRKVCTKHTNTMKVYLTSGYIQTNPRRDEYNHTKQVPQGLTSISPRRVQSMAKPRSRQANIGIKHRNKQANIDKYKRNDPNPLI